MTPPPTSADPAPSDGPEASNEADLGALGDDASESDAPESFAQKAYEAPEGSTQILLVRHGSSAAFTPGQPFPINDEGQGDPPLSPDGQEQALLTAGRLATEPIDAIYVTNLVRTQQTAAPLVEATGIEPIVERDLREAFMGEWEGGLFRQKIREPNNPIAIEMLTTGRWDAIPGGESNEVLATRCLDSIWRIVERHTGANVVAFVHGGVIRAILSELAGVGTANGQFGGASNCSIHHLVVWGDTIAVRSFNDTAHLGPAFASRSTAG